MAVVAASGEASAADSVEDTAVTVGVNAVVAAADIGEVTVVVRKISCFAARIHANHASARFPGEV